jgi:hypothetical protein
MKLTSHNIGNTSCTPPFSLQVLYPKPHKQRISNIGAPSPQLPGTEPELFRIEKL